jgi:hypothetical protein
MDPSSHSQLAPEQIRNQLSWVETYLIAVILTLMDSSSEVDLKIALAEVVTTTE